MSASVYFQPCSSSPAARVLIWVCLYCYGVSYVKQFRICVCSHPLLFFFYCFFFIVRSPSYLFTLLSTADHILQGALYKSGRLIHWLIHSLQWLLPHYGALCCCFHCDVSWQRGHSGVSDWSGGNRVRCQIHPRHFPWPPIRYLPASCLHPVCCSGLAE